MRNVLLFEIVLSLESVCGVENLCWMDSRSGSCYSKPSRVHNIGFYLPVFGTVVNMMNRS